MLLIDQANMKGINEPLVATIGFFDGVHLGHRHLINLLRIQATSFGYKTAVITFTQHPRTVLNADFQPALLTTPAEKIAAIETTGVDFCIQLNFTLELAQMTSAEFIEHILFKQLHVRILLVGHDHRFGKNRSEGLIDYVRYGKAIGLQVQEATRFVLPDCQHISSSTIRNALQTAQVETANKILSYPYSFEGIVTDGFHIGRKLGFPTANIQVVDAHKLIPASAVYAVKVQVEGSTLSGMMNIGFRPTISDGLTQTIEVHLFDFEQNIYNKTMRVFVYAKLRNEMRFENIDQLINQLHHDKRTALKLLTHRAS